MYQDDKKPSIENKSKVGDADSTTFHLPGLIRKLLQSGVPRQIEFQMTELAVFLEKVKAVYQKEKCALIELSCPVNICGSLHGQYTDLLRIFKACGSALKKKYLFLGNYVNKGRHSLEIIILLFALKLALPNRMYLLRGAHETNLISKTHGFYAEIKSRYRNEGSAAEWLFQMFQDIFSLMPLAAVVSGRILCMSGGISPHLKSLDDIRNIPIPLAMPKSDPLAFDLLWSVPRSLAEKLKPKEPEITASVPLKKGKKTPKTIDYDECPGDRYIFGEKKVHEVCSALGIDMIIRSQQVVEFGYEFFASKRLITVFSASRFIGDHNYSAVVLISSALEVSFLQLKPEDYEVRTTEREREIGPQNCH